MRLTALLLSLAISSAADNDRAMRLLRDWIVAVDEHIAGERDGALRTLAAWSDSDLEMMRTYVENLAGAPMMDARERVSRRSLISSGDLASLRAMTKELTLRGGFDTFLKRAAMLHTDVAILSAAPAVVTRPPGERNKTQRTVIVRSFDGQVKDFELDNLHWDFATDLLDALPATPQRDSFVGQWYRGVAAYLVNERRFADALAHFDRARRVVPDDPGVLYGEACLQEILGAPRVQDYVRVTTLPGGMFFRGISSPPTHWRRAESLLRRALAIDPAMVEARLRLGRIAIVLDRHQEGLHHLQQAIAESKDRVLTFYGNLFSGDAELSLGRHDDARISYERALALFPNSQAGQLGLAAALRTAGDADALQAMMPTLTTAPEKRDGDDPWWDYYFGDAANVESLLEALRAPYRSPTP